MYCNAWVLMDVAGEEATHRAESRTLIVQMARSLLQVMRHHLSNLRSEGHITLECGGGMSLKNGEFGRTSVVAPLPTLN